MHALIGEHFISVPRKEEDLNVKDLTQEFWFVVDFNFDLILEGWEELCELLLLLIRFILGTHLDEVSNSNGCAYKQLTCPIDVDFL